MTPVRYYRGRKEVRKQRNLWESWRGRQECQPSGLINIFRELANARICLSLSLSLAAEELSSLPRCCCDLVYILYRYQTNVYQTMFWFFCKQMLCL